LLELLIVLALLLVLHLLVSGFQLSVSTLEIIIWIAAGLLAAVVGPRLLWKWITEGATIRLRWRKAGPVAEALARLRHGELQQAENLLRGWLEHHPRDLAALRGLAEVAFCRGDFEQYLEVTVRILGLRDGLSPSDRIALCHRQADVCLEHLNDPKRAVEALARIEVDYPRTTDAFRARKRIERILSNSWLDAE